MMRLLVADGHGLTRAGIRRALEDDESFEIVAEADSGMALLPRISQSRPDLVLLDLQLQGVDAHTSLERIRAQHPKVLVVGLAFQIDAELLRDACECGLIGLIVKTIAPADLGPAIRQIVQGTTFTALGSSIAHADPAKEAGLTEREQEILSGVARGLANKQIAKELWVTEQTIKFHLTNIYRKLGLLNRTAAAQWAYRHGLAPELATTG